jgi:hypothetical protein
MVTMKFLRKFFLRIFIFKKDKMKALYSIKTMLRGLPKANYDLLKYLVNFLIFISSYGSVNKMTLSNISIVFGPNLLWPREETLESILSIPRLNGGIQFILESAKDLFD